MEKIYMEENNNRYRQKSRLFLTTTLSFVVAIFAMVSIAFFGISTQGAGISFAADDNRVNNGFTLYVDKNEEGGINYVLGIPEEQTSPSQQFLVPLYYSDSAMTKPVFCVERERSALEGSYVRASTNALVEDPGLIYILKNSYAAGKTYMSSADFVPASSSYNDIVEKWFTQSAIWLYLHDKGAPNSNLTEDELANMAAAYDFYHYEDPNMKFKDAATAEKFHTALINLVDAARSATSTTFANPTIQLTLKSDSISQSKDQKYYQSDMFTVSGNPSDSLVSYSIELEGVEGAIVVDANGNKFEKLTDLAPTVNFYVRVPVDKVTEKAQKLNVKVIGKFNVEEAYYYVSATDANAQKVVRIETVSRPAERGLTLEFTGTPDTGLNITKTIYFIGLIVLLCGVGIIYANAKQVEVKQ